jgi:hypothetical protein
MGLKRKRSDVDKNRRTMAGWSAREMTTEIVLSAAMRRSWFSQVLTKCLGRQSVQIPQAFDPKRSAGQATVHYMSARVSQKKAHHSELPAWLPFRATLHLATTLPRWQVGVGNSPTLYVDFSIKTSLLVRQPFFDG